MWNTLSGSQRQKQYTVGMTQETKSHPVRWLGRPSHKPLKHTKHGSSCAC